MTKNEISIQVGGMSQSGSTLLYNIVRLLLEINTSNTTDSTITHRLHKDHTRCPGFDYYIVSLRDIRDTTLSWMLKEGIKNVNEINIDPLFSRTEELRDDELVYTLNGIVRHITDNIMWLQQYNHIPETNSENTYFWGYEKYKMHPVEETRALVSFLKLNVDLYPRETLERVVNEAEGLIEHAPAAADGMTPKEAAWNDKTKMLKIQRTANKGRSGHWGQYMEPWLLTFLQTLVMGFLLDYGYATLRCPHCNKNPRKP
jgi:hypothetical protein